jgi:hypothetical protein
LVGLRIDDVHLLHKARGLEASSFRTPKCRIVMFASHLCSNMKREFSTIQFVSDYQTNVEGSHRAICQQLAWKLAYVRPCSRLPTYLICFLLMHSQDHEQTHLLWNRRSEQEAMVPSSGVHLSSHNRPVSFVALPFRDATATCLDGAILLSPISSQCKPIRHD